MSSNSLLALLSSPEVDIVGERPVQIRLDLVPRRLRHVALNLETLLVVVGMELSEGLCATDNHPNLDMKKVQHPENAT